MNTLVSTLVAAAVVLELVGLVGVAVGVWSIESTVVLWLLAFGLLVVARGCERFEIPTGSSVDATR
ncbi:hypothetical protein ACFPYI_16260 [Halomarina salina]|uniref:Uncharacterized protein n=1 Tax=Halomarina salina TaxID=1872699 RepID=A0ABD5RQN7_9EURY|nr:hypothetical protein [Halomarina salina]